MNPLEDIIRELESGEPTELIEKRMLDQSISEFPHLLITIYKHSDHRDQEHYIVYSARTLYYMVGVNPFIDTYH